MVSAIFVISCWKNFEQRQTIRKTWAKLAKVPLKFVVGRYPRFAMTAESLSDVITVDAPDDYLGLPQKVAQLCGGARMYDHILKVDDDAFVAADRVVEPTEDYVGKMTRNGDGRPWYCHGGAGYWMSSRLMNAVWENREATKNFLSEDAFVSASATKAGIFPVHSSDYNVEVGPYKWKELPRASNTKVVAGEFQPFELRQAFALYGTDDREDRMTADEYRKKVSGRI